MEARAKVGECIEGTMASGIYAQSMSVRFNACDMSSRPFMHLPPLDFMLFVIGSAFTHSRSPYV
jgi:hypothetical protein